MPARKGKDHEKKTFFVFVCSRNIGSAAGVLYGAKTKMTPRRFGLPGGVSADMLRVVSRGGKNAERPYNPEGYLYTVASKLVPRTTSISVERPSRMP